MVMLFRRRVLCAMVVTALAVVSINPEALAAAETLQAIIDRVEHDNDSKVLSVQEMTSNGRKIYVIKMLSKEGRVKVVQVRASE